MSAITEATAKFRNDVTFVIVVSKLCNLRCRYCYEYPDLSNRQRMSLANLTRLFASLAQHFAAQRPALSIRFAWQGGEPLLHEPAYFRAAFAAQRDAFAGQPHQLVNVVQSNLTRLDDERIELLKDCFDGVGVSHDVVGSMRVDAAGNDRGERTLHNIERLIDCGVALGGITVLSRHNIDAVDAVYGFWRNLGMPFRLLPVHRGPFPQADDIAVSAEEIYRAYCAYFERWVRDPRPAPDLAPLGELLAGIVASHTRGGPLAAYDKLVREPVLIVDTSGALGGVNDLLDAEHAYGNVFQQSLDDILASERHLAAAERARKIVALACRDCPFFKTACSGYSVAEGGKDHRPAGDGPRSVCPVTRRMLAYIERRLTELGLFDAVSGQPCAELARRAGAMPRANEVSP